MLPCLFYVENANQKFSNLLTLLDLADIPAEPGERPDNDGIDR